MRRKFYLPPCPSALATPSFRADAPWLAPLAGYSDLPFRMLCREFGAKVCETEMISAKGLIFQSPGTGDLLRSVPQDQPLVVQLFGSEPEIMGQALLELRKAGYSFFDCNMGCPVRKVLRQKAGAALMAEPETALAIARAMLSAAWATGEGLADAPARVGFKLRLPPFSVSLEDFCRRLEDEGAAWITLHPRSASQFYKGSANHAITRKIAEMLEIPLIASGDLMTAQAGLDCLAETGARAVMYARGALGNPMIFTQHAMTLQGKQQPALDSARLRNLIERHIELARRHGGDAHAFGKMRSLIPRYVKHLPGVHALRLRLVKASSYEELGGILDEFFECGGNQPRKGDEA